MSPRATYRVELRLARSLVRTFTASSPEVAREIAERLWQISGPEAFVSCDEDIIETVATRLTEEASR